MTDRNERRPGSADKTVRDIRRTTRRKFSAEEKVRIVLEGLPAVEACASGFPIWATRTARVTPDRCLQRA